MQIYYNEGMRTAETEINVQIAFRTNDKERREFKLACMIAGEEMATVLRQYMRDYVKQHKKK